MYHLDGPMKGGRDGYPDIGTGKAFALRPFTAQFNVTGQPAVSLPLAWSSAGLPIGVQLVAAYAGEDLLIRLASQLKQAQPWSDRGSAFAPE